MTDKERLEEAKLMAEMLRVETRLPHDFPFDLVDWLVEQSERVQELETTVDFYQSALRDADRRVQELENHIDHLYDNNVHLKGDYRLQEQNKRYRETIEEAIEYANSPKILTSPAGIEKILSKALEGEE